MPSPKTDTVTTNIVKTIEAIQKGRAQFKNDNTGNVHFVIGKKSFSAQQLLDNLKIFILNLRKLKPSGTKGTLIKSIFVCSTMGKSIEIDPNMSI
jgi:large subunit ribosomal protein L1